MKVNVNKDACLCCGNCAAVCENVFTLDNDGFVELKVQDIPKEEEENVTAACDQCPTSAISIEEEQN